MPNTFRDKKVEEGLDESVRSQPTRRRPQIPHDEEKAAPSGNSLRQPAAAAQEARAERQEGTAAGQESQAERQESRAERQETAAQPAQSPQSRTKSGTFLSNLLGGEVLNKQWVRKQRKLLLLIAAFCILLVTNRYYVEHLTKDKLATEERIKFLREERIQMKKDYQESVKISHIASELDSAGVGLIAGPPYELTVDVKKDRKKKD